MARADEKVTVTFTVKTDADKNVAGFRAADVEVKPRDFRDYVTRETAANDPRGCYKSSFDSRRFEECKIIEKVAWLNVVDGMRGKIEAVMLNPAVFEDEDGAEYARYFLTFGPKQANTIFIITMECVLRR